MVILVIDGPSSLKIKEMFGSFTFHLHWKEMRRKKFQKVIERDGQVREITKDEVLFEKTYKDLMLISTNYVALTQASVYNISMFNEKLVETKSENKKLEKENINLKVEVKKKWKVDDHLNSLK